MKSYVRPLEPSFCRLWVAVHGAYRFQALERFRVQQGLGVFCFLYGFRNQSWRFGSEGAGVL